MERKSNNWKMRKIFKGLLMLFFLIVLPFIIMSLWNAILPEVLNATTINYWQALGLFILSTILFGGCRSGGPGKCENLNVEKASIKEKFMHLTDEAKAVFRERSKDRCKR